MPLRKIEKGQLLVVRGRRELGLTPRGRILKSSKKQMILFKSPNQYKNIELTFISGPMEGATVLFTLAICRKPKNSNLCKCTVYHYPHAKGKGKCKQTK